MTLNNSRGMVASYQGHPEKKKVSSYRPGEPINADRVIFYIFKNQLSFFSVFSTSFLYTGTNIYIEQKLRF